jgi:hypothetical protein
VRIVRYTAYQLTDNTTTRVPTGIAAADFYCSFGGWDASYDVQETGTGTWSRHLYTTASGLWEVKFFNNVQNGPLLVSFDVICYRQGFYQLVGPPAAAGSSAATNALPSLDEE